MIRDFRVADRDTLIDMMKEFYASPAVLHPVPEAYFSRTVEAILENSPYVAAFIAEQNGVPAGYGLVSLTYSNEAGGLVVWLEELYIRDTARGLGLGSALIGAIEARYRDQAARLRLEVEEDNDGAMRLYSRLGYAPLPYSQMIKETSHE